MRHNLLVFLRAGRISYLRLDLDPIETRSVLIFHMEIVHKIRCLNIYPSYFNKDKYFPDLHVGTLSMYITWDPRRSWIRQNSWNNYRYLIRTVTVNVLLFKCNWESFLTLPAKIRIGSQSWVESVLDSDLTYLWSH